MLHRWRGGSVVQRLTWWRKKLNPSKNESLQVPPGMKELLLAGMIPEKACPNSNIKHLKEWFIKSDDNGVVVKANAQDTAFFQTTRATCKWSHILLFSHAQRDRIWDMQLHAFQSMWPCFMHYNKVNYARWGAISRNEMHQLPQEIQREFEAGNFVGKRSPQQLNQVDPDQSQEWLGCIGKRGGSIIGKTKVITPQEMGIVFQLPIPSCQWIQNRLWSWIRWVQYPQDHEE